MAFGKTLGQNLLDQRLGAVDRDAHADALDGGVGCAASGVLQRRNAHQLAEHVEHAAAGVAGVDGRVDLNHVVGDAGLQAVFIGGRGRADFAVQRRHDAHGRGAAQLLRQRISDADPPLAHLQLVAVAQRNGRKRQVGNVHDGDIERFILSDELAGQFVLAAQRGDGQAAGGLNHVVIGKYVPVIDDHAGAGARQLLNALARAARAEAAAGGIVELLIVVQPHHALLHGGDHAGKGRGNLRRIGGRVHDLLRLGGRNVLRNGEGENHRRRQHDGDQGERNHASGFSCHIKNLL